jgi:hypothetical protein
MMKNWHTPASTEYIEVVAVQRIGFVIRSLHDQKVPRNQNRYYRNLKL